MTKSFVLFGFDIGVFVLTFVLYSLYHHEFCTLIMGPIYLVRVMIPRYKWLSSVLDLLLSAHNDEE